MGKVSQKTKGKNSKLKQKSLKEELSSLTVEQLIEKVNEKINTFDYEAATEHCNISLERFPENLQLLELSANASLEIGNFENAKLNLEKAITLQPDRGHTKYFSLAQLLSDNNALQCYKKGVEIILEGISELKTSANEVPKVNGHSEESKSSEESNNVAKISPEEQLLHRQLSSGYCSIAELYTSELCDEEGAENECLVNIQKAIESDTTNPEAYIQQANLLLIKEEFVEAKESILKSVSLWLPKYLSIESGEAEEGSFDPSEDCCLSEEHRVQSAKILIEVEEYNTAYDILEGLLGEDDEDVQVWYLIGWNFFLQGDKFKILSKQHLRKALQFHNTTSPCPDQQLISHVNELLEEMKDVDDVDSEDEMDDLLDEEEDDEDSEEAMETAE